MKRNKLHPKVRAALYANALQALAYLPIEDVRKVQARAAGIIRCHLPGSPGPGIISMAEVGRRQARG